MPTAKVYKRLKCQQEEALYQLQQFFDHQATMPEAITYFDMRRRIAKQVPHGSYHLQWFPKFFADESKRITTLKNSDLLKNLGSFEFSGMSLLLAGGVITAN